METVIQAIIGICLARTGLYKRVGLIKNLNELKEKIAKLQFVLTEVQDEIYELNDTIEALGDKLTEAEELLTSMEIDDNPEFDSSENGFIIRKGMLPEYYGTETEAVIPDSVIKIGEGAFKKRTSIRLQSFN